MEICKYIFKFWKEDGVLTWQKKLKNIIIFLIWCCKEVLNWWLRSSWGSWIYQLTFLHPEATEGHLSFQYQRNFQVESWQEERWISTKEPPFNFETNLLFFLGHAILPVTLSLDHGKKWFVKYVLFLPQKMCTDLGSACSYKMNLQ